MENETKQDKNVTTDITITLKITHTNGYTKSQLQQTILDHLANWDIDAEIVQQ